MKALALNGDKFQSLQVFDLSSNQISDKGVETLAVNGDKFKSLR
jgi:hypothetical protein